MFTSKKKLKEQIVVRLRGELQQIVEKLFKEFIINVLTKEPTKSDSYSPNNAGMIRDSILSAITFYVKEETKEAVQKEVHSEDFIIKVVDRIKKSQLNHK